MNDYRTAMRIIELGYLQAELIKRTTAILEARDARIFALRNTLLHLVSWSEAYPKDIFPEMSEEYSTKAHEILAANGMSINRISASAMRHVIEGVGRIAREALDADEGLK